MLYDSDDHDYDCKLAKMIDSGYHPHPNFGPSPFGYQPPPANSFTGYVQHIPPSSYPNQTNVFWSSPTSNPWDNQQGGAQFSFPNLIKPSTSGAYSFPTSKSIIENDLNINKKRPVQEQELLTDEFDFDSRRPIKKYICEEKVLEIFDRLHIREGDHYIVEDVPDEEEVDHFSQHNPFKHNVSIEEIIDTDCQLEYSPQLKDALQVDTDITNKLYQLEQEKLSKALVVYQPNPMLESLRRNDDRDQDEKTVEIVENLSDDEEVMEDMPSDTIIIEQIASSDEDTNLDVAME